MGRLEQALNLNVFMLNKKISHLAHHLKDGSRWTVEQMLADALSEIRAHRKTPTKALLILLNDEEDKYDVGFIQSGLSMSQTLALTEVAKTIFLKQMGYLE